MFKPLTFGKLSNSCQLAKTWQVSRILSPELYFPRWKCNLKLFWLDRSEFRCFWVSWHKGDHCDSHLDFPLVDIKGNTLYILLSHHQGNMVYSSRFWCHTTKSFHLCLRRYNSYPVVKSCYQCTSIFRLLEMLKFHTILFLQEIN